MSSIQNPSMASGRPDNYSVLSDAKTASYTRKQSLSAYQSLNAGLTIQTKEGDQVTLTSNTYAQLDAFKYNSEGLIQTEEGTVLASEKYQEITLASGDSFSFSVVGDLSEAEMADIKDIIKGIDEIIEEMASGDMDEAIEKAMGMGSYDSVSMYAADISLEKNYQAVTETQVQAAEIGTQSAQELLPKDEPQLSSKIQPYPDNHAPKKKSRNSIRDINRFVERMTERLEQHDDKQLVRSRNAMEKLFNHHLRKHEEDDDRGSMRSAFNDIDKVAKRVDKYIDKIAGKLFDAEFSLF